MILVHKWSKRANAWGVLASSLCLLHCLATPLFFTLHANLVTATKNYTFWWRSLDLIFVALSFLAVTLSTFHTSKSWMKYALWGSWAALMAVLLNERFSLIKISEVVIFIPTMALIVLHLINHKYCKCQGEHCCNSGQERSIKRWPTED